MAKQSVADCWVALRYNNDTHAQKLELDVDLGDRFNLLPCPTDYNWDCLGDALHATRGYGICFC
jgi:hypothetical protein